MATNLFVGQFSLQARVPILGSQAVCWPTFQKYSGRSVRRSQILSSACWSPEIFTRSRAETNSLIWYLRGHDKINREEFDEVLAKELVMYSLLHFPLENTVMAMKNTFSLMSISRQPMGFHSSRIGSSICPMTWLFRSLGRPRGAYTTL